MIPNIIAGCFVYWAITVATMIVIGAVGPLIWAGVPPKIAAKNPKTIAPIRPALAPKPEETPKARARGRAMTPVVMPPIISPLTLVVNFLKFPKILKSDPIARMINAKIGDLIKIIRKNNTGKESIYYRVVIEG